MWFLNVDSFRPYTINDHQILREHIRALIIFGRYVLRDGVGEGDGV
jgi:hypothetical protein